MEKNRLIIAAAGAGKTTYMVEEALNRTGNVIITTFTIENESEIRNKILKKCGYIPKHITIQTWFSFLLQHGVKPYQGTCHSDMFGKDIKGILLVEGQSGVKYTFKKNGKNIHVSYDEESEFLDYYFCKDLKIYTDKLAKFVCRANKKAKGYVIDRISRIYPYIYIDEIQDLSGYDLEIVKLLYHSQSEILCVGDPRQVTYSTHWERKNQLYRNGNIKKYIVEQCYKRDKIIIDENTLNYSHRNNKQICDFSSLLYPNYPHVIPCSCADCHPSTVAHQGIYLVRLSALNDYLSIYKPVQLKYDTRVKIDTQYDSFNFGESKGKGFDRVIIYPTGNILKWLFDHKLKLEDQTRAKLYVAITRARYSVAFVLCDDICNKIKDIPIWYKEGEQT